MKIPRDIYKENSQEAITNLIHNIKQYIIILNEINVNKIILNNILMGYFVLYLLSIFFSFDVGFHYIFI